MADIKSLTNRIIKFRDARDWKQFHNPKDVSLSLVLEAGEVMEHFQWKTKEEVQQYLKANKDEVKDEIADIAMYLFELADNLGLDLIKAMEQKLKKNSKKYPVAKAKGSNLKYNKL